MDTQKELERNVNSNIATFGGYINSLNAFKYAQQKINEGFNEFSANDLLKGFGELQHAGLDVKKNFELAQKVAITTGNKFSDVANIIRRGNFSALAEMGVITDRSANSWNHVGLSIEQAKNQVINLLNQADKMGKFEGELTTIEGLFNQMRNSGQMFLQSILGDPKDKDGLAVYYKKELTKVVGFISAHATQIQFIGKGIGMTLKAAMQITGDFAKRMWKDIRSVVGGTDGVFKNMQQKLLGWGVFLELIRLKVARFFDDYGGYIKTFLEVAAGLWVVEKIGAMMEGAAVAVNTFASALKLMRAEGTLLTLVPGVGGLLKVISGGANLTGGLARSAEAITGVSIAAGTAGKEILSLDKAYAKLGEGGLSKTGEQIAAKGIGKFATKEAVTAESLVAESGGLSSLLGSASPLLIGIAGLTAALVALRIVNENQDKRSRLQKAKDALNATDFVTYDNAAASNFAKQQNQMSAEIARGSSATIKQDAAQYSKFKAKPIDKLTSKEKEYISAYEEEQASNKYNPNDVKPANDVWTQKLAALGKGKDEFQTMHVNYQAGAIVVHITGTGDAQKDAAAFKREVDRLNALDHSKKGIPVKK